MSSVEERLDRIEKQIAELRESIAYLRGVVEQLDKRFTEFRDYVERRLNHLETELRELRAEIRGWVRWMIGILVTMWVTIIAAVLLK